MTKQRKLHGSGPSFVQLGSGIRVDRSHSDERAHGLRHGGESLDRKTNWPQRNSEVPQVDDRGCEHELECAAAMQAARHSGEAGQTRTNFLEAPPFTVVSTLRKVLKHLEWTETATFCWKHVTAGEVDMGALMEKRNHSRHEQPTRPEKAPEKRLGTSSSARPGATE